MNFIITLKSVLCVFLISGFIIFLQGCSGQSSQSLNSTLTTIDSASSGSAGSGADQAEKSLSLLMCNEAQLIKLINLYRLQNAMSDYKISIKGVGAARWHANDMLTKNYFSHTEPDGRDFVKRGKDFDLNVVAENIAAGYSEAQLTFCQWKNSPGHNANILNSSYTTIGLGFAEGQVGYKFYWSSHFIINANNSSDEVSLASVSLTNCVLPETLPSCSN